MFGVRRYVQVTADRYAADSEVLLTGQSRRVAEKAPLLLAQHLLHGVTLRRLHQTDLGLDQLQDLVRDGAGVELHSVKPPVHEVEHGVDRAPVDSAEDLLLARLPPLAPPGALEHFLDEQGGILSTGAVE